MLNNSKPISCEAAIFTIRLVNFWQMFSRMWMDLAREKPGTHCLLFILSWICPLFAKSPLYLKFFLIFLLPIFLLFCLLLKILLPWIRDFFYFITCFSHKHKVLSLRYRSNIKTLGGVAQFTISMLGRQRQTDRLDRQSAYPIWLCDVFQNTKRLCLKT